MPTRPTEDCRTRSGWVRGVATVAGSVDAGIAAASVDAMATGGGAGPLTTTARGRLVRADLGGFVATAFGIVPRRPLTPDSMTVARGVDAPDFVRSRQSVHLRVAVGQQRRQLSRSQPEQVRSGAPREPGSFDAGTSNRAPHCSQNMTTGPGMSEPLVVVIGEPAAVPASMAAREP
jgi:hypothetical protein